MLIIRPEHIAAFNPQADDEIEDFILGCILENHLDLVIEMTDEDRRLCVRSGMKRARQYEIKEAADLATFICLMLEFAPNFDEHPLIKKILTDTAIDGSAKIREVINSTTDAAWQDTIDNYDERAWLFGLPPQELEIEQSNMERESKI